MKNDKLLPCPFCDCKLHKHHRYYHHEINGCLFDDYMFFKEDFNKWNTRKPVELIVEELETEKIKNVEPEATHAYMWNSAIQKAIACIRSGGKADNKDNIKKFPEPSEKVLAVLKDNHISIGNMRKDSFFDIVNNKAILFEEVIEWHPLNEFCIFENTEYLIEMGINYNNDGFYKPSCIDNEDNFLDYEILREFKHCPYCGKRILLTECIGFWKQIKCLF